MQRRAFLQTLASASLAHAQSPAAKRNIVWLIGDQHRGQALSCMYDSNVQTPNVDAMAHMGVNFTHAVSGFPLCCPSGLARPAWMEGTDWSHYRVRRPGTKPSEPDSAYLQNVIPTGHADSINKPYRGVVTRDGWKYVCFDGISWLMFNLQDDLYEMANLAHNSKYKAERGKLIARLRQWIADTGDKFNVPSD